MVAVEEGEEDAELYLGTGFCRCAKRKNPLFICSLSRIGLLLLTFLTFLKSSGQIYNLEAAITSGSIWLNVLKDMNNPARHDRSIGDCLEAPVDHGRGDDLDGGSARHFEGGLEGDGFLLDLAGISGDFTGLEKRFFWPATPKHIEHSYEA